MSVVELLALVAMVGSIAIVALEILNRKKLTQWRKRHEMSFISLNFILMLVLLNMALIILYSVNELLWTDEHQYIALLSAMPSLLFGIAFLEIRGRKSVKSIE